MRKLSPLFADSSVHVKLGKVVIARVTNEGGLSILTDPMPGHKLSVLTLTPQVAVLFQEGAGDILMLDVLKLENIGSLDAKTRESFRHYRDVTGIMVNPLTALSGRKPLAVPEGMHSIFWAYHN